MSESLVERIKRLQAARDRGGQPGAPTAGPDQDRLRAEILPTTVPTHNTKDKADQTDAVRAPAARAQCRRARSQHAPQWA